MLTMCIKEAMRLYPVLHHVGRQVDEDVLLRNGVTLEKGMTVGINIYSLHRNPIVWEDADVRLCTFVFKSFESFEFFESFESNALFAGSFCF